MEGREDFEAGVFRPTQEEIDQAMQEGGQDAVDALMAKFAGANSRLRDQQGDEAVKKLEENLEQGLN